MTHILLVEDDIRLSELISEFLRQEAMQVTALQDGAIAAQTAQSIDPDLIILDVMLPGMNGFELCKNLRKFYQGPLLFMTAKGEAVDQILGLEIGADDYVVKPVEPRILLARIHALLRRTQAVEITRNTENQLQYGQLIIDKTARRVQLDNNEVPLTSHEFDMLCKLADNPAQVVDRETLYAEIIGREYDGQDRSVDVRISRLRKKLNDNAKQPYRIKTIWGKGFFFVADAWD